MTRIHDDIHKTLKGNKDIHVVIIILIQSLRKKSENRYSRYSRIEIIVKKSTNSFPLWV
jgi:hypothetical protein